MCSFKIIIVLFLCHLWLQCTGKDVSVGEFGVELCDEKKEPRQPIVVGNLTFLVHHVKIERNELSSSEVSVRVIGGNDQFCQALQQSGVWWPMEVVIGMCALFQHVRTKGSFMFVPTAKTRRRVKEIPSSVETVLTIAFKRNGCACLEIPAAGRGTVLVHDVTMCSASEHVREKKVEEWKSVIDVFTRASVLWKPKSPVPFKCIPCEDAGEFGQFDSPVHCVAMVRMLLLGKIRGDNLPWPSPLDMRKQLVREFHDLWVKLQRQRKFVFCHNDRGLEGGLHTFEDAKVENPTAVLLSDLLPVRKRGLDGSLVSQIVGCSDIMTAKGVSSNKQRSVVSIAMQSAQRRRIREKKAKHESKLQNFHKMKFPGPMTTLMKGGNLVKDATYYFASPHHMPPSPLVEVCCW